MTYSKKEINDAYITAYNLREKDLYDEALGYLFKTINAYLRKCASNTTSDKIIQEDIISECHRRISSYMPNFDPKRGKPMVFIAQIVNSCNARFSLNIQKQKEYRERDKTYQACMYDLAMEDPNYTEEESLDIINICDSVLSDCKMDAIMRTKNLDNIQIDVEKKQYLQEKLQCYLERD